MAKRRRTGKTISEKRDKKTNNDIQNNCTKTRNLTIPITTGSELL
jgi:hypothetical protein